MLVRVRVCVGEHRSGGVCVRVNGSGGYVSVASHWSPTDDAMEKMRVFLCTFTTANGH